MGTVKFTWNRPDYWIGLVDVLAMLVCLGAGGSMYRAALTWDQDFTGNLIVPLGFNPPRDMALRFALILAAVLLSWLMTLFTDHVGLRISSLLLMVFALYQSTLMIGSVDVTGGAASTTRYSSYFLGSLLGCNVILHAYLLVKRHHA
jgi:hypothetical protein